MNEHTCDEHRGGQAHVACAPDSVAEQVQPHLAHHVKNVQQFGVPVVVALNRILSDTDAELKMVQDYAAKLGVKVILTEVWKNTPFVALLLLAALAAVPEELLETARVDGASRWQRVTQVVLPGIRPVLLVVVLFRLLDTLRVFDTVFVQTGGAYGTSTLSVLAYDQLVDRVNLGLGSAVSVLLFALSAGVALAYLLAFRGDLRQLRGPER